jgi:hypothetical protein
MANYKQIDDALALVENLCTAEQIHSLLATRKGESGIRLTAENKTVLVDRNLREALEAKAVTLDSVFNLIRDAEENGNQHIFYFRSKTKKLADALSLDSLRRTCGASNAPTSPPASLRSG